MMWDQPGLFDEAKETSRTLTVSEITARIRVLLEQAPVLQDVWVAGEVSNFSRASSGHIYFTLKDAGAQLSSVVWKSQARALGYMPKSGDQVVAHGRIGVYEPGGRYQLYVDALQPTGRGALYQEFERLKARLEAEGLFDPARKRPLPPFPRGIGVATSPTAAALRDVLNVLGRRYPLARVLLAPTPVQGDAAPPGLVAALAALNARADLDVILLVRGGGSLEDLWAFNDERVARAVAGSRLPVISGVGHETDFSLADFAADHRAPTPSAAAELATPDLADLRIGLTQQHTRLERAWAGNLDARRERVAALARTLQHLSPEARLSNARQRVDDLAAQADRALTHRLELARQRVAGLSARLTALDPEAVLARGYAIVRERETRAVISATAQAQPGLALTVQLRDGEFEAVVE